MQGITYVTLSAQIALQKELETVANNVANSDTAGFKADRPLFESYLDPLQTPGGGGVTFVQDAASYIDRSSGEIETTGNPLDIALDGKGYLSVATKQGTMYSRDGHLQAGSDNTLLGDGGNPLLGADGAPIQLPDGYTQIQIKADGSIKAKVSGRWTDVAQIGVYMPNDPTQVQKSGSGLLSAPQNDMQAVTPDLGGARIIQGSVESSTVKPMKEIANMTELSRAYDRLQSVLNEENDIEEKMIDTLSKPS